MIDADTLAAIQANADAMSADQEAADMAFLTNLQDARKRIAGSFAEGWTYPGGLDAWLKQRKNGTASMDLPS